MAAQSKQERQRTVGHGPTGMPGARREPQAPGQVPSRRRGEHLAPAASERGRELEEPDGRRIDGLGPLWIFFFATLAIVGGVILANAVDRWWILVPVMCVFFASAFGVLLSIVRQLRDDGETS